MKTRRRILAVGAAAVLVMVGFVWLGLRRDPGVAERYQAELRAKGEKLSFLQLGFPRLPENGDGLARLTNAVTRIQSADFDPRALSLMRFVGPGRAQVYWRAAEAVLINYSDKTTNGSSWATLNEHLRGAAEQLSEIRAAVEQPLRWFLFDPASSAINNTNAPRYPFVAIRGAAQWLSADAVGALHAGERDRVLLDLHALAQLAEFNQQDPTLVAQMIRMAVAGLGLNLTWEALQESGWAESDLAAMQRACEGFDSLAALEAGFMGERAWAETISGQIRKQGAQWAIRRLYSRGGASSLEDRISGFFMAMAWRPNAQEDQLLVFQHYQKSLEGIRDLRKQRPWPEVRAMEKSQVDELDKILGRSTGLRKFRYLFSAAIIPNYLRATQTVVRNETQRRLTVVAIALKRYELEHHRLPSNLPELLPAYLSVVPIDPMNGQPLHYRANADGSFLLYSVGEDGRDDGGDPTPSKPNDPPGLWSGRDAVWPAAEGGAGDARD